MSLSLGNWAVIDIETTGISPGSDDIIDVGFLQFEDDQLIRTYESLVSTEQILSQFIQRLTGITQKMVVHAPSWKEVENEVQTLYGHTLLAHNSEFEKSFLEKSFDAIDDGQSRESYEDSLFILGTIFPYRSSLKLEQFIIDFELADSEQHRGLADSVDLLKVMLLVGYHLKRNSELEDQLFYLFQKYDFENCWSYRLVFQDEKTLIHIANQIDFDLSGHYDPSFFAGETLPTYEKLSISNHQFSGESIKDIFEHEEDIKKILPYYTARTSQIDLALRVGQSQKNGVHALIQAPTGTGKTLGYLIPSILNTLNGDDQVLVATGTKTLQEQAYRKDIPVALSVLGLTPEEYPVVKLLGSSNHLCSLAYSQEQNSIDMMTQQESDYKWASIYFEMIFFHNEKSEQQDRITRRDTSYVLRMKNDYIRSFDKIATVDYRSCTGHKCPVKQNCSYFQGLQLAKDAKLIIGNHALMYTWPSSFPRPLSIVVDEAHRLEHETTQAFTLEVSQEGMVALTKSLQKGQSVGALFYLINQHYPQQATDMLASIQDAVNDHLSMVADHLPSLIEEVESWFKQRPRYNAIYWNEAEVMDPNASNSDLEVSIYNHLISLQHILKGIYESILPTWSKFDLAMFNNDADVGAYNRFEQFWSSLEDILDGFEHILEANQNDSRSICFHEKEGFLLKSSPIDVGKMVYEKLLLPAHSVVMTSATLGAVDPNLAKRGIEWSTGYLHVDKSKRFKQGFFLPSVYDYENKAKVFLCTDVPSMNDSSFIPSVLDEVIPLLVKLHGRALLLFSSKVRFESARELLLDRLNGKLNLYVQGMSSTVVDDFKQDRHGVLLGMESFGEGIDIPGDALQFVFIDKVPDIRMDLVTRQRQDFFDRAIGNAFLEYNLAGRTRSLHQKLGRLLRTEQDFGGVIIADSRLARWKGKTISQFDDLMRPYIVKKAGLKQACDEIYDFIESN